MFYLIGGRSTRDLLACYKLTEKREKGPLHGLPFSVKEHFFIKGKDSTVGLYSRIGQPANENAQISKYQGGHLM